MADPTTVSEQLERQRVLVALQKRRSGHTLTKEEHRTLKRWDRQRDEESRWAHYNSIPQKHWREMSGRQAKVLLEQAERHGIRFGGRTICLPDVVKDIHDFLARNARILARADEEDLHSDVNSPALERLREENFKLRRLERRQREGELVDRSVMHDCLSRLGGILRRAGDRLQRRCGPESFKIYNEALDAVDREIRNFFGEDPPPQERRPKKRKS